MPPAGLEIVLTLGAAYGCHFVTEDLLGASGLLAVVVMGFSMSILGRALPVHPEGLGASRQLFTACDTRLYEPNCAATVVQCFA